MAELVQLSLERTIPELEEMIRTGLFTKEEISKIVKKRRQFEYKLRRHSKRKEDFLEYIEYEICVLNLISKRRERLLCESKKQEIDHKIAKRINRLFKAVIGRFPADQKLILDQIQFCKKMKWYDNINILHNQMLRFHSRTPSSWIIAAKWEMEETRSPENARKFLQRGVLLNPKSKPLWREYFRMEMMYIDLLRKRREVLLQQKMEEPDAEENDVILSGKIPMIVFDKALEEIDDDVEFALSFIEICLEFGDFSRNLLDHIFEIVIEKFPGKEETLDAIAKLPLLMVGEKIKQEGKQGIKKKITLERINAEIFSKYEEAIECNPTEKMWSLYIDFVLNLFKSSNENKKKELEEKLIKLMERAASFNCLSLAYYTEWVDFLFQRGNENALLISLTAARKWNKADLWSKTLTFHIQCLQPVKKIYKILNEAVNSVPEKDSLILWKLGVDWISLFNPENLNEFLEKGMKKCKEVSTPLKDMYLQYTSLKKGSEKVLLK